MKTSVLLSLVLAASVTAAPRFGQGQFGQGQQGNNGNAAANNAGAATATNATTGAAAGAAGAGAATAGAATAHNATAAAAAASGSTANSTAAAAASGSTANNSTSAATGTTGSSSTGTATQAAAGSLSSSDITQNATADSTDAQSSTTLDPRVIATGFLNNGQDVQEAGQVASLTSNNNFINYCLTQGNLPITNGKQIQTGSCNPAPIGTIPAVGNMPSAKFSNPANGASIPANQAFTITMNIQNLDTGNFVNANENYFAAPQQLNAQGLIVGHTHVVVEALDSVNQTSVTNPQEFAFFKGVNTAAVGGAVTADVTNGVPAGAYRLCSINSSSNHQPVIVPIAQHGALDDCVYFTATGGAAESPDVANEAGPAAESAAAAAAASSAAAGGVAAAATSAAAGGAAAATATAAAGNAGAGAATAAGAQAAKGAAQAQKGQNGGQNGNGRGKRMMLSRL
jgi:hypothetical protein